MTTEPHDDGRLPKGTERSRSQSIITSTSDSLERMLDAVIEVVETQVENLHPHLHLVSVLPALDCDAAAEELLTFLDISAASLRAANSVRSCTFPEKTASDPRFGQEVIDAKNLDWHAARKLTTAAAAPMRQLSEILRAYDLLNLQPAGAQRDATLIRQFQHELRKRFPPRFALALDEQRRRIREKDQWN